MEWGYIFELLAMCISGISGVLALRPKKEDLINVMLLGTIAAVGGGTTRDILLSQEVFWVKDPNYFIFPSVFIVITFFYYPYFRKRYLLMEYVDAAALSLFVASTTVKVYGLGFSPTICVIMAVVTGVFGGIYRDVIVNRRPLVFGTNLYITPALLGAIFCVFMLQITSVTFSIYSSLILIIIFRMSSIKWSLKLPDFMFFKYEDKEE